VWQAGSGTVEASARQTPPGTSARSLLDANLDQALKR